MGQRIVETKFGRAENSSGHVGMNGVYV